MEILIDTCIQRYNISPKQDQFEKNRCFLAYGTTPPPLENIKVAEKYLAKDCPNIRVIYTKYCVRKHNTRLWGRSKVISIRKNFRKDKFFVVKENMNEQYEIEILQSMKRKLEQEKKDLENEIAHYYSQM